MVMIILIFIAVRNLPNAIQHHGENWLYCSISLHKYYVLAYDIFEIATESFTLGGDPRATVSNCLLGGTGKAESCSTVKPLLPQRPKIRILLFYFVEQSKNQMYQTLTKMSQMTQILQNEEIQAYHTVSHQ